MKKLLVILYTMLLVFGMLGIANAALWDRGGGLIYDDVMDITWLQDANYAATDLTNARRDAIISTVGSVDGHVLTISDFQKSDGTYTGEMTWWGALAWVDQLQYYDSIRGVTYDDWRLPDAHNQDGTGPDYGFVAGSEMGYMHYINLEGSSMSFPGMSFTDGFGETCSFLNLQAAPFYYFTSTARPGAPPPGAAWIFAFQWGQSNSILKDSSYLAWAVRDGDPGPVPVPASMLLLGSGLIGIVGIRRKFKK